MPANLENSAVVTRLEKSVFISIPKKGNSKECSNYCTIALISYASSHAQNSPSQASAICESWTSKCSSWIRKGRGTRDQMADISWIIEKAREFHKNICFCFIDYTRAFDCVDHNKLWKILQEAGIPDHLVCLLRNLYAGQEATVRTGHGTTDWFQIRKGVHQVCISSPYLFNLYSEYIMRNAGLEEAQAGIKIAGRQCSSQHCLQ